MLHDVRVGEDSCRPSYSLHLWDRPIGWETLAWAASVLHACGGKPMANVLLIETYSVAGECGSAFLRH